jgi:hypothetical protein
MNSTLELCKAVVQGRVSHSHLLHLQYQQLQPVHGARDVVRVDTNLVLGVNKGCSATRVAITATRAVPCCVRRQNWFKCTPLLVTHSPRRLQLASWSVPYIQYRDCSSSTHGKARQAMGQKISVPERIHRAAKLNDISELQVRSFL